MALWRVVPPMARLPRIDVPDLPRRLMIRGNNRSLLFQDDSDRWVFMRQLAFASSTYGCSIHAYVLMSNHVHLLATGHERGSVSRMMQSIGRRYARFVNARHGRTGTLFEGRFKSSLVESDRYFLTCMRYIESNPVRAGMAPDPGACAWSSFRANASGAPGAPLVAHGTYLGLADDGIRRGEAYKRLFDHEIPDADLEAIRTSLHKNCVLACESFRASLEADLRRPVGTRPRGGARKFNGDRLAAEPANLGGQVGK
jgi:putative transposase